MWALCHADETCTIDRNANVRKNAAMPHKIVAVISNGVSPFEMTVPHEVFGVDRSDLTDDWYEFRLCAAEPTPITTSAGFTVDTPHGLDELETADTIIVVATRHYDHPPALLEALRRAHERGVRIASICTGAYVLAAAGLLDGRKVTTHWRTAEELAAAYPMISVDPNVLYIDDGDIATSAGTAAGIDLCLHFVRKDLGAEIANAVARRLVVPPHRDGGQAQFIEHPMNPLDETDLFDETLAYARDHLGDQLTVDDLARQAAMSPRTFARRFREVTGTTPHQWIVNERVRLAQRLLETNDRTVDWIAIEAGFGTATNMRQHFQRTLGVAPGAYRRSFRRRAAG